MIRTPPNIISLDLAYNKILLEIAPAFPVPLFHYPITTPYRDLELIIALLAKCLLLGYLRQVLSLQYLYYFKARINLYLLPIPGPLKSVSYGPIAPYSRKMI